MQTDSVLPNTRVATQISLELAVGSLVAGIVVLLAGGPSHGSMRVALVLAAIFLLCAEVHRQMPSVTSALLARVLTSRRRLGETLTRNNELLSGMEGMLKEQRSTLGREIASVGQRMARAEIEILELAHAVERLRLELRRFAQETHPSGEPVTPYSVGEGRLEYRVATEQLREVAAFPPTAEHFGYFGIEFSVAEYLVDLERYGESTSIIRRPSSQLIRAIEADPLKFKRLIEALAARNR